MTLGEERVRRETGMVTAELAVSLVTLLLVLALVLGALRAGGHRTAAVSVAAAVAREHARGGDSTLAWERLRTGLPTGSTVHVSEDAGLVLVAVRIPRAPGIASAVLPDSLLVEARALKEAP